MEFNSDCPKCRERATEIANSCESKFDLLQAKYQKMVLAMAVTSGVVGKEIMNEVYSFFSSPASAIVAPVEEVELPKISYGPPPVRYNDISYLADVPALTPRLWYTDAAFDINLYNDNNSHNTFDSAMFIPEAGGLLGLTLFS